jgi:hypothetical protein
MKKTFLFILLISVFTTLDSQNFSWAKQYGMQGNTSDDAFFVATDGPGNVYISGYYKFTTDFDPGPGTYTLSSTSNTEDVYVMKTDPSGNLLWAKGFGGNYIDVPYGMAVDNTSGDVVVVGFFKGIFDCDPSAAAVTYTSANADGYIVKLDNSGNYAWSQQIGGPGSQMAYTTTIDGSGNVYVTGGFTGIVDFDPGPGTYTMGSGGGGGFILKLTSSGAFVWARQIATEEWGITTDPSGSVFLSGAFNGTIDIDPGPSTLILTPVASDIFILKLNASGNFVWVKQIGGPGNEVDTHLSSDPSGNITMAGDLTSIKVDFDPGPSTYTLSTSGSTDTYVAKYDNNGNFLWARSFGGSGIDEFNFMSTDPLGNVYTTGYFNNTVDFDPGPSVFNLSTVGGSDGFIHKLDASGNFVWAYQISGPSTETPNCITARSTEAYIVGSFNSTVDFDPSASSYTLSAPIDQDAFIMKLGGTVGIDELQQSTTPLIFPNPVTDKLYLKTQSDIESIIITNVLGKEVFYSENINKKSVEINTNNFSSGIYFVAIREKEGAKTIKIIKQ